MKKTKNKTWVSIDRRSVNVEEFQFLDELSLLSRINSWILVRSNECEDEPKI